MAETPYHLRQKYGMKKDCGPDRKVWRAPIIAYRKEAGGKKEFASLYFAMTVAGALTEIGEPASQVKRVSQEQLKLKLRLKARETVTRRLSKFSGLDGRWDDDRRRKMSQRQRDRAKALGRNVHESRAMRSVRPIVEIFNRNAGFGRNPNIYSLRMDPNMAPRIEKESSKTAHAELLAQVFGPEFFDPGKDKANGYKKISAWLFDENLPLDDYGRVLAAYYELKGIHDEWDNESGKKSRKIKDVLEIAQNRAADELGLHPETVHKYEQQLCDLQIIRIIPGELITDENGIVVGKTPRKLCWLTDKLFTHEMCVREMDRYCKAQARIADERLQWAVARAAEIHKQLLVEWEGKEHCLAAFYNELRRRFGSAALPKAIYDLIPRPPD